MDTYDKTRRSPIKSLSDNWFELLLITVVLAVIILAHYLFNVGGVLLNFFYLPVIIAAHYFGRFLACTLATFSVLAVAIFTAFDPAYARFGTNQWLLLVLNLSVWASFLGLSAILVGTLSDRRRAALRHVLRRCMNQERDGRKAPSVQALDALGRVESLFRSARETLQRQQGEGAVEILQEVLEKAQREVDRSIEERRALEEAPDAF